MAKGWKKHQPNVMKTKAIRYPTEQFRAFTTKFNGLTNRIVIPIGITPAFDPSEHPGKMPFEVTQKLALWDTGATGSVLTSATVKELNLSPVGVTTINHAGGASQSNTYLVNLYLPNKVGFAGVIVSECEDIAGNFGAIIGMDIITRGDFALTNVDNKTVVSFRVPSMKMIDYVEEHNKLVIRFGHLKIAY